MRLRQLLVTNEQVAHQLEKVAWRQAEHEDKVQYAFETIQQLIEAPAEGPQERRYGFRTSRGALSGAGERPKLRSTVWKQGVEDQWTENRVCHIIRPC